MNKYEDVLIDYLRQLKEVLEKYNVEFWLDCGTLLGAVREGRFLTWEHDIDVGVFREKISDEVIASLAQEFIDKGFRVFELHTPGYSGFNITIKKTGVAHNDIVLWGKVDGGVKLPRLLPKNKLGRYLLLLERIFTNPVYYELDYHKTFRSVVVLISRILPLFIRKRLAASAAYVYYNWAGYNDNSWFILDEYFKKFKKFTFYGMEFNVPADTESYLTYRYGTSWKTPIQDWVTGNDDGACKESKIR